MKDIIDNLNKLRLQLIGVANQKGCTDCALLVQDVAKEVDSLKYQWNQIKGQDVIFKHLLTCKEFDAELDDLFTECLADETSSFDYHYEGIDLQFSGIHGHIEWDAGDYETPPVFDHIVNGYEVTACYYCDEGDFEDIAVDGALLELLKLKLKF